ncbi:MAG: TetR/AcrR family transcriptional regulator [Solirubrobacteraceae bacterium]|nr:TetR/AcrR family transcriptional regulator [Solirubrobacteraceae bacterium]
MGLEAQGLRRHRTAAHRRHLHRAHATRPCVTARRSDTRERMLDSASELIRQRGASATSIDDILAHSGTPRGSVYYHFPAGRTQIIEEAVDRAGGAVERLLADAGDATPVELFDRFVAAWRSNLIASDFRSGCPVLAAAIESTDDAPTTVDAARRAFTSWRTALAGHLRQHGASPARARRLANVIVGAVEGAVVLSRAEQSIQPVDDVTATLRPLLQAASTPPAA